MRAVQFGTHGHQASEVAVAVAMAGGRWAVVAEPLGRRRRPRAAERRGAGAGEPLSAEC